MPAVFESILPIFLLIAAGNLLRRFPGVDNAAWPGLEQLGFWFLYPALLFVTIVNADFSGLALDALFAALLAAIALMIVLLLALWPPLRASGLVARSQYSSLFQTGLRWNGFMALAIAEELFPPAGAAVVALVMAVIIVPVNVASVLVVTRFAQTGGGWRRVFRGLALNPLILASLAALAVRWQPFGLYGPLNETLDLVGRAALGMGLLAIGAGLRPGDVLRPRLSMWIAVALKLAVFPLLLISIAVGFGVRGPELHYLGLCAAVPTAMNGYLLARQLGGDAGFYAAVVTLQTAIAFFTIPLVLSVTAQLASG